MTSEPILPPVEPEVPQSSVYRWYHKLFALAFIVFCLEVGVVLLVFPWLEFWGDNYFAGRIGRWSGLWGNAYLRGGVSGLGIVNIYISFSELFRLRRFRG